MDHKLKPMRLFIYPQQKPVTGRPEPFFLIGEDGKVHKVFRTFSPLHAKMVFQQDYELIRYLKRAYRTTQVDILTFSQVDDITPEQIRARVPNLMKVTTEPVPVR